MRRDDARPLSLVRPLVAGLVVAAVELPLVVWALLESVWLGLALTAVAGAAGWAAARLAALIRSQALELDQLRSVDTLTGLPNRRVWDDALPRELARSARAGTPLAVAILAVDGCEPDEDEHARQDGELLLKELAALWLRELRESDVLARYGTRELVLLLPECGLTDVDVVLDKLRAAITPGVTCSAGVAIWDGLEDASAFVRRAEAALVLARCDASGETVVAY